jgi:hypothetical protein
MQTFVPESPQQAPQTGWAQLVPSARHRWEYLLLHLGPQDASGGCRVLRVSGAEEEGLVGASLEEALRILGAEEWELAAVDCRAVDGALYLFKRPL